MNAWTLPTSAEFGGVRYPINSDYRDVLEVIRFLIDTSRPNFLRWQIALGLFYEGEIPRRYQQAAMEYLSDFISYGSSEERAGPKLIDWDQDAMVIIGDVNKAAGVTDIRAIKYLHWWTFLSYFYNVGDGQLATIVSIRNKKRRRKKLEKWEEEYYRENKSKIDFKVTRSAEDLAAQAYFEKWL